MRRAKGYLVPEPRDPALALRPPSPLGSIDPRRQARRQIPRPRGLSRAVSTAPPSGRSARRRGGAPRACSPARRRFSPFALLLLRRRAWERGLLELEQLQPPCREGQARPSACCSGMLSLACSLVSLLASSPPSVSLAPAGRCCSQVCSRGFNPTPRVVLLFFSFALAPVLPLLSPPLA